MIVLMHYIFRHEWICVPPLHIVCFRPVFFYLRNGHVLCVERTHSRRCYVSGMALDVVIGGCFPTSNADTQCKFDVDAQQNETAAFSMVPHIPVQCCLHPAEPGEMLSARLVTPRMNVVQMTLCHGQMHDAALIPPFPDDRRPLKNMVLVSTHCRTGSVPLKRGTLSK